MRTFKFRHLAHSWGIAVDLTAVVLEVDAPPATLRPIADELWLDPGAANVRDVPHLLLGFDLMSQRLDQRAQAGGAVIRLEKLEFPLTDFQPEGLTAAAVHWVAEEFDLDPHPFGIAFVPPGALDAYPHGHYLFDWMIPAS